MQRLGVSGAFLFLGLALTAGGGEASAHGGGRRLPGLPSGRNFSFYPVRSLDMSEKSLFAGAYNENTRQNLRPERSRTR